MFRLACCAATLLLFACGRPVLGASAEGQSKLPPQPDAPPWYTFNGDLMAQKYARETQITPQNVHELHIAWQLHTGDVSNGSGKIPATVWSATPLFVNNTLYVGTPFYRIFAVEPDTGHVKWIFNPHALLKALTQPEMKNRGIAYWQAEHPVTGQACQKIVYIGTMDAKLFAVDADTGKPCQAFADHGMLDFDKYNTVNAKYPFSLLQPPTVFNNKLFLGWSGKDWAYQVNPLGLVMAFDAQTGAEKWAFNLVPPQVQSQSGKINIWSSMSVDTAHHMLFVPSSPPSPDDYGGDRKQPIPLASAVIALNADTGALVWSRQLVHHGLWDFDLAAAPVLVDIQKDGKTIPALVQSTKQGYLFVLNRLTGAPIYPIEETLVPKSDVPGEQSAPTQPETRVPEPTVPQQWPGVWTLADIVSFGGCSRQRDRFRYEGPFTPPSLGAGSIGFPASAGGVEWGGGAVDPTTQTYVVNSSEVVQIYRLLARGQYEAETKGHNKPNYYPMAGAPYGINLYNFVNWLNMPCWNPPFGTITAYDLRNGKTLWRKPFGEVQRYGFYMPGSWGSVTIGAPVITKSGLIFIGASMDSRVRALDLKTGKVLWRAQVDAPAVAMPAVFAYHGKAYIVWAVGGNSILLPRVSDQLVAFALPG